MQKVLVYEPNKKLETNFFKGVIESFKNIYTSRELIFVLFKRDFTTTYKKSFIGVGWILIAPIVGILSWVFMNQTGILSPGEVGIPYPAYVLISSAIWGLFMGFYSSSSGTLGAGSEFIMQVDYPHEALFVKQIFVHIVNFFITFVINLAVLLLFGVDFKLGILLFPMLILPLFFLGSSVGLMMSVINVVAPDVVRIFNFLFSFVFYITPVIYAPASEDDLLAMVIKYNPLTYLVGEARDVVVYGQMDNLNTYLLCSIISLLFFTLSWRLFYVSEERVIEKMI